MSRIKIDEKLPLNENIIIEIIDLAYSKKSILVKGLYNDILFDFAVFWTNGFSSVDNLFSFKIHNEQMKLEAPEYKIIARFDSTKTGYLKCLSAKIYE